MGQIGRGRQFVSEAAKKRNDEVKRLERSIVAGIKYHIDNKTPHAENCRQAERELASQSDDEARVSLMQRIKSSGYTGLGWIHHIRKNTDLAKGVKDAEAVNMLNACPAQLHDRYPSQVEGWSPSQVEGW